MKKQVEKNNFISFYDLIEESKIHEKEMDKVFRYIKKTNELVIYVSGNYEYFINLCSIKHWQDFVRLISHLCGKNWVTAEIIDELINRVVAIKKWDLHLRR